MLVKKIVSLKNIGRFKSLAAAGDVQFKRVTLIYGPNGQGKTTLAGVLRSLQTGDRAYVDERATLGTTDAPQAKILLDGGLAEFTNGAWSTTAPTLAIFDTTFVNDNVYTGEHVGPEHRKNLYEVVVGAAAVALVREIDEIDTEARQLAGEVAAAETDLKGRIQTPFSLEDFLVLAPEADLPAKIQDRTTRLSAVRKQQEILSRPQLDRLSLPELPASISAVLGKSVEQIAADVEEQVRRHLQRLDHRGEAWIRQGQGYLKKDRACPFCGQDTSAASLPKLYAQFFSNAYKEHLVEVERASTLLDQTLGESALTSVRKRVLENDARIKGWSDLASLQYAALALDRLEPAWIRVRDALRERLQRKLANPSEVIPEDSALAAAIRDYTDARKAVDEHNASINKANSEITSLKQNAAATKPETLEQELRRLRNMEIRQTADVEALITKLQRARQRRKELADKKEAKKDDLKTSAAEVLAKYQESINRLLQAFGANFTIVNARPVFPGGKASSSYQLELNSTALDIGDPNTPRGKPCFRTALSTGDKSTLALAFFLARLEQEAQTDRCIVIDDPLSSFDAFRGACTQQQVGSIAARAGQTIVMSHDAFFLKGVLNSVDKASTACLQVVRDGDTHVLRPWDVDTYFLHEAHQEYFLMRSYLSDGPPTHGDLTSIARAIRPYLEGHLRSRFPDAFAPTEWLGDMIGKIRAAAIGSELARMTPKLDELSAINEYSKPYHHSSIPAPQRPSDTELQAWVRRALAWVQAP